MDVEVPAPFGDVLAWLGALTDGALDDIPSVACSFGGSFRNQLLAKALMPLVLLGLCQARVFPGAFCPL